MSWPAVRTEPVPFGWRAASAFVVGGLVVLFAIPFLAGRSLDIWQDVQPWPDPPVGSDNSVAEQVRLFLVLLEFSPLLSVFGILIAFPLTWFLLEIGGAGWLVFTAIYGFGGGAVVSRFFAYDPGPQIGSILTGYTASAALGLSFWLGIRLAAPSLFRSPHGP